MTIKSNIAVYFLVPVVIFGFSGSIAADVALDGSLGNNVPVPQGPDYEITADMGKVSGNNLYHSFQEFNLSKTQSASFYGPTDGTTINNIIGRITGGPSTIDGSVTSHIDGANLYLINSDGIMFGPNATIDISGSFYATTADFLKFSDNGEYSATAEVNPILSSAEPAAFGFLDSSVASIDVQGSQLAVLDNKTIGLVGGKISISGSTNGNDSLKATDGQINLVSVTSEGEVAVSGDNILPENFLTMGEIKLDNQAKVSTSGNGGGRIVIRGGKLTVDNANIAADTTGTGTQDSNAGIDIAAKEDVTVRNEAHISTNVKIGASGDSNGVTVESKNLKTTLNSSVESLTEGGFFSSSTGNGGDIIIKVEDKVTLENGGKISTLAKGRGDAGNISIHSHSLEASSELNVDIGRTENMTGVIADSAVLLGDGGRSGNIDISLTTLNLQQGARISSNVNQAKDAGHIAIDANTVNVFGGSRIQSLAAGAGVGGDINIDTNIFTVAGSYTTPSLFASAPPTVRVSQVTTNGGGDITVSTDSLEVSDGGRVQARNNTLGLNNSGDVEINANSIKIAGLNIEVFDNRILRGDSVAEAFEFASSSINTNTLSLKRGTSVDQLNAGEIRIDSKIVELSGGGRLASKITGSSAEIFLSEAGDIDVNADDITISSGSLIQSGSLHSGNAGKISLTSNTLLIDGSQTNYDVYENAPTGINSTAIAESNATAGDISINNNEFIMKGNAVVTSESIGAGSGGNIEISTNSFDMLDNSNISSSATQTGVAGDISILIQDSVKILNSAILSSADISDGGNIEIDVRNLLDIELSEINTSVNSGFGKGGNIELTAETIVLQSSDINASAIGGPGGNIDIKSNQIFITPDSNIVASSEKSVDGEINIQNQLKSSSSLSLNAQNETPIITISDNICQTKNNSISNLLLLNNKTISNKYTNFVSLPNINFANLIKEVDGYPLVEIYHDQLFSDFSVNRDSNNVKNSEIVKKISCNNNVML